MRSVLCAATTSWGESGFMNRWYSGTSLGADASGTETTAAAAIARTERRIKGRIGTSVNRLRGSITRDAVLYAGRRHRPPPADCLCFVAGRMDLANRVQFLRRHQDG